MPEENENLDQEKYTLSAPADPGNGEPLQILAPEEKIEEKDPAVRELPLSDAPAGEEMPLLEKADLAGEEKLPESFRKEELPVLPLSDADKKEEEEEFLLPLEELEPEKEPRILREQAPVLSGSPPAPVKKVVLPRKSISLPMECGSTPGELLAEARKRAELSLDEVKELTKIHKETLIALENNDLASLPPAVFIAGYARTLQELYALDAASRERLAEAVEKLTEDREEDLAGETQEMKNKILRDISSTAKVNVEEERRFQITAFCVLGGLIFFFIVLTVLILFLIFGGKKSPAGENTADIPPFRAENISTLIPEVMPEVKKMELPEGAIVSVKPAGKKPGKRVRR